jgi:hypothetical protein
MMESTELEVPQHLTQVGPSIRVWLGTAELEMTIAFHLSTLQSKPNESLNSKLPITREIQYTF